MKKLKYRNYGKKYSRDYAKKEQLDDALRVIERLYSVKISLTKADG
ncbi:MULTISPECIES: hypothetical protein [Nostoc]|uniref:Transposase n=1 Tax=Nostoc favosum CHAB5714 TaxID=2780399 RepID=A0ABS8I546_9NOSO|nr:MULTISPECIES: hypothetical protein [Nostoc]MCC5599318.1 hypothetical protein [Nostoc favosum CHAB5714]